MNIRIISFCLLVALAGIDCAQAFAQQDDDVRGAFLTTRPKTSNPKTSNKETKPTATTSPNRRRPKAVTKNPTAVNVVVMSGSATAASTPAKTPQRIGLGLTLFMRDANGLAVRANPTREFHKGDHVRLLLETNADGYLYVFNTTDSGSPVMIYPDPELDEAGNYMQAHVPFEIPSSVAAEERLRWFTFDEHAGAEKLYFVFTREPLASIPIEDDLITYCRDAKAKCPWHPATGVWAQIQKELSEPVQMARTERTGKAQTSNEHRAVTRGIGLNRDDPEPSLILLTASTTRNMLVATLDLVHKAVSLVDTSSEGEPK